MQGSLPEKSFISSAKVQIVSVTHPAKYSIGNGGSFPGVKRPVPEDGLSPPSTVKIKNE
jgi:hypothetical protein